MSFHSGALIDVHLLDHHFEFIAASVHVFELGLGDELFVVEFGNLLLWVESHSFEFVPLGSSIDLSKEIPLPLSLLGLR